MSYLLRSTCSLAIAPAVLLWTDKAVAEDNAPTPPVPPPSSVAPDPTKPAAERGEAPKDPTVPPPADAPGTPPVPPDPTLPSTGGVIPGIIPGVQPLSPLPPGGMVGPPAPGDGLSGLPGTESGVPLAPIDPLAPQPDELASPVGDEWSDTPATGSARGTGRGGWEGYYDQAQVFGYGSDLTTRSGSNGLAGGFGAPGFSTNPLLEGFRGTVSVRTAYDSNPSMGYGPGGDDGQFYSTLAFSLDYRSTAPDWTYGVSYSGGYNWYFDDNDLSGYNQRAGAGVYYSPGGPFSANLNLGFDFGSGANRYYQAVTDELRLSANLGARYILSPKTSLVGSAGFNGTMPGDSSYNETTNYTLNLSGMWAYSELTEFGPGIRYTYNTGDTQENRQSFGPTFTVNYAATAKVRLHAQVGVDAVEYEQSGSGDPAFNASLGANYRASELWGLSLSVARDTGADQSWSQGFEESTIVRLGYNRSIRRATLSFGASYEFSESQMPDDRQLSRSDRDYFALDCSLGMPVFRDEWHASVFVRYTDQSGGSSQDWDSFQGGLGLSYAF